MVTRLTERGGGPGPSKIVAAISVDFADTLSAGDVERIVARVDERAREKHPEIVAVLITPQSKAAFERSARDGFRGLVAIRSALRPRPSHASRGRPHPVPHLGHIFEVLADISLMSCQHRGASIDQRRGAASHAGRR
jgi:hypothetical protein